MDVLIHGELIHALFPPSLPTLHPYRWDDRAPDLESDPRSPPAPELPSEIPEFDRAPTIRSEAEPRTPRQRVAQEPRWGSRIQILNATSSPARESARLPGKQTTGRDPIEGRVPHVTTPLLAWHLRKLSGNLGIRANVLRALGLLALMRWCQHACFWIGESSPLDAHDTSGKGPFLQALGTSLVSPSGFRSVFKGLTPGLD